MILSSVFDALGRSYVWEEGLGDYHLARRLAAEACRLAVSPEEKAWAWFSLGIVHLLRGNIRLAQQCWKQIDHENGKEEVMELLQAAARMLAVYEGYNTKLDGSAAESIEVNAHWDTTAELEIHLPRLNTLRMQSGNSEAQFLAWYLSEVIGAGKSARSMGDRWNTVSFPEESMASFTQIQANLEKTATAAKDQALSGFTVFPNWLRADILHRAQKQEAAEQALDLAEKAAREENDPARQALCLLSRGDWLSTVYTAFPAWDFALVDSHAESSTLASTIESREFPTIPEAQLKKAATHYRRALKLFTAANASRGTGMVYLRMAHLEIRSGRWEKAEKWLDRSMVLFREKEDFRHLMLARTYKLLTQLRTDRWRSLPEQAAVIGRWGHWSGDFSFTQSLGMLINRFARYLFLRQGRYEAARMAYQTAHALFTALGAPVNATQNVVDLALLHEAVGDFTTAIMELQTATDRYLHLAGNPPPEWVNLPAIQPHLIKYATLLSQHGFKISSTLMDADQMIGFQKKLITVVQLLNPSGELPKTPPQTWEEMRIFSLTQVALMINEEASVLVPFYRFKHQDRANNQSLAAAYWEEAYRTKDQLSPERALFYEAILWGATKDHTKATLAFHQYLKMRGDQLPPLSAPSSPAGIAIDEKDLNLLNHGYFWEEAFTMWSNLENYQEAEKAWEQRCELEDEHWWEKGHAPWQTGSSVARMYEGLHQYETALSYCRRSLELLDLRRKELSRDELKTAIANDSGAHFLYHLGARLAFLRNEPEAAFYFVEQGKARALLDLLSAHPDRLALKKQQRPVVQQWRECNAKLQALRGLSAVERRSSEQDSERIKQLERDIFLESERLKQLEEKLVQEIPAFFSIVGGSGNILDIAGLQSYLQEGQLFIGYSYFEEDLFTWAVNQQGLLHASRQKIPKGLLSRLVSELHQACQNRRAYTEAAGQLAQILLHPLLEWLKQHDQVYLAPSGGLHLLPFHALPLAGKPLGETHSLSFLPSAGTLQYFEQVKLSAEGRLLAVGNPTGDLQAAAAEANFAAQLFKTKALIGKAANEAAVRRAIPGAEIVHLATHGNLSEEAPLASSLLLSNQQEISLYELMGMHMGAELVVLSACETGKGAATSGDDVVGLTRGLLAAGAKSAVVSFWSVDDVSTALFMQYFYEHLKTERSPAGALAYAQRKLRKASKNQAAYELKEVIQSLSTEKQRSLRGIKLPQASEHSDDYSHPFYWAPFFYVGRL